MKSLKNMPESLETMTDSVRLRPLFWKYFITAAMFWFVCWETQARLLIGWKVSHDQSALSLNLGIFRTVYSFKIFPQFWLAKSTRIIQYRKIPKISPFQIKG